MPHLKLLNAECGRSLHMMALLGIRTLLQIFYKMQKIRLAVLQR
jgi:hypothetical protein